MKKTKAERQRDKELSEAVAKAFRAAARQARKTARMYGTPIYILKDGKVVAKKP